MPPIPPEDLHYDDQTLVRVSTALRKVKPQLSSTQIADAINRILEDGIVFREVVSGE